MFREELRLRVQERRVRPVKAGGKLMEKICSSENSGFLQNTRRCNPEDGIFEEIFVFPRSVQTGFAVHRATSLIGVRGE
jgi:hypothetical protein